MRKIASLIIGALVSGLRAPIASKYPSFPCRAMSNTNPGAFPAAASCRKMLVMRSSRSDENPRSSGLVRDRSWPFAACALRNAASTASAREIARIGSPSQDAATKASGSRWLAPCSDRQSPEITACVGFPGRLKPIATGAYREDGHEEIVCWRVGGGRRDDGGRSRRPGSQNRAHLQQDRSARGLCQTDRE